MFSARGVEPESGIRPPMKSQLLLALVTSLGLVSMSLPSLADKPSSLAPDLIIVNVQDRPERHREHQSRVDYSRWARDLRGTRIELITKIDRQAHRPDN